MSRENKRRIPYQWRLFLPLVCVLWVILFGVAAWQIYRNHHYKEVFVNQQLQLINSRISRSIRHNNWGALENYKKYLHEFYTDDKLFDDIRFTVYDQNWEQIDTLGPQILISDEDKLQLDTTLIQRQSGQVLGPDSVPRVNYYLQTPVSVDGKRYVVVSSLPDDRVLNDRVVGDIRAIWIIVFVLALFITIAAFIAVKHLAKNINLLREFANRTADDPEFVPGTEFAHDELGDIARKIVQMYNDRAMARQQIEREHKMTMHTVEEKSRQKRQLTNNINHELKTPIGVIKGYLDTIAESPDMDEATRLHFINKAREHANRLANLVADVLAITRLEEGENQLNTEELDFHEIAYVFANDARESGVLGHFKINIDIPLGTYIVGNGNLLVAMLMNLTKNAVNYSGGDRIFIEYRGEDNKYYHFSFSDNGMGVPPAALEHLFERFYRIDSGRNRRSGGTGLGLAIVFNTVKAHRGTITVNNRESGGLEFRFSLLKWDK